MKTTKDKDRFSFFLQKDLSEKIYKLSRQTSKSISNIAREALTQYLQNIEKERIEKELDEGYKANYNYFAKQQDIWKYADSE